MNICFVNSTRKWGGVKTWCISTASEARSLGVHSVIFGKDVRFIERAQQNGIDAHKINFGFDYNPAIIWKFYSFFKYNKIECVIVNVGKDLKSAGIAARILGIHVIHRIGSPGDVRNTVENNILHHFIKPSLICCSEYTKQGLVQNLPYLEKFKITVIHPGVNISDHSILTRKPYKLITTSQLNEDKRHIDVIHACRILADSNVEFSLMIVGEGALSEELRQRVTQFGLDGHIQFAGYTNDVIRELRTADFFILPSRREPLGIALEEAMANGLVPIARNAGGVPEIWPEFLCSDLLPPESRGPEFASVLKKFLQMPEDAVAQLKERVREHARSTFSTQKQSQRVVEFITSLSNKNTAS